MAHEALLKAACCNAEIIMGLVVDNGACPTRKEIDRICAERGYCDEVSIDIAVRQLVNDGHIKQVVAGGLKTYVRA